jgi:serine/threonine protein kinase
MTQDSKPQEQDESWVLAGRYRVDRPLAHGGQGGVWRGYDERLDRRVAIKLLHQPTPPTAAYSPAEAADLAEDAERARQRFLREIRTTARLELPGIPAIYDTGVNPSDGRIYLVMQLLDGATLAQQLAALDYRTAPPAMEWAAAIGAQIAATLIEVHRADIVHRDIKPANVIVTRGGLVKLLDFGVAILRGRGALPRLTHVAQTVGTAEYMSPEQCVNSLVGPASDIYSLGAMLHELLTGRIPFTASASKSLAEHHLWTAPAPVTSLRPDVSSALEELVLAMLAKQADARPSAQQTYEKLLPFAAKPHSVLDDEDRDPSRLFRKPFAPPKHPRTAPSGPKPAVVPSTEAEAAELREHAQQLVGTDQPQQAIDLLRAGLERAASNPEVAMDLQYALGVTLFYADEHTKAGALFARLHKDLTAKFGPNDPQAIDASFFAGISYAETNRPAEALDHLSHYLAHHDDAVSDAGDPLEADFVAARMLAELGRIDEARTLYTRLRQDLAQTYGPDSVHVESIDRQIAILDQRSH